MINPLPSVSQAYYVLIQEEKQREIRSSVQFGQDSASFNVNVNVNVNQNTPSQYQFQNQKNRNEDRKPLICNYCKKPGHPQSKCYKLHGYLNNNNNGYQNKFNKGKRVAAMVNTGGQDLVTGDDSHMNEHKVLPRISSEQIDQLMTLL